MPLNGLWPTNCGVKWVWNHSSPIDWCVKEVGGHAFCATWRFVAGWLLGLHGSRCRSCGVWLGLYWIHVFMVWVECVKALLVKVCYCTAKSADDWCLFASRSSILESRRLLTNWFFFLLMTGFLDTKIALAIKVKMWRNKVSAFQVSQMGPSMHSTFIFKPFDRSLRNAELLKNWLHCACRRSLNVHHFSLTVEWTH